LSIVCRSKRIPATGRRTDDIGDFVGLGNPAFNNSGCAIEFSTACSGNVRKVASVTGGFYKGPFGRLTGGLEYMFVKKLGLFSDGSCCNSMSNWSRP
jgi:hypothetical protein